MPKHGQAPCEWVLGTWHKGLGSYDRAELDLQQHCGNTQPQMNPLAKHFEVADNGRISEVP